MSNTDWRLTNQKEYLLGKALMQMPYSPYRPGWEHEHCAFCSGKIDEKTLLKRCLSGC
jgi:hypothetical protein